MAAKTSGGAAKPLLDYAKGVADKVSSVMGGSAPEKSKTPASTEAPKQDDRIERANKSFRDAAAKSASAAPVAPQSKRAQRLTRKYGSNGGK